MVLSLIDARIRMHQLLVPVDAEEVFQKDAHQLLRFAPGVFLGQNLGEMAFRLLQIKTNHDAKIRKFPYLCRQFYNRPFDRLRDLAT